MNRQSITPLALGGITVACVAVAAATGNPVWAAALGGGLAAAHVGPRVPRLAARAPGRASTAPSPSPSAAWCCVWPPSSASSSSWAILDRDAFATAALSFLAAFTVYTGLRLFLFVDDRPAGREVRPS